MLEETTVEDFCEYSRVIRGCREATVGAYRHDLTVFRRFLVDHPAQALDVPCILGFICHLRNDRANGQRAIQRKLATLGALVDYLLVDGQMDSAADPRDKLPRLPSPPATLPRLLTEAETEKLLAAPDGNSVLGRRDRAILVLLYTAGLRAGEVCRLTVASIDWEGEILRVEGKGGSERSVPLHPLAAETLRAYLAVRPVEPLAQEALFVSKKRGPLTVRAVEFLVARHAEAAGLDQHVHPHMLRHSCATHLLRRGAPLEAIRKLLGHQNLASTQVYLHLAPEDVRTALERHPIRRTWPRVWATAVGRACTYQGARRARAG